MAKKSAKTSSKAPKMLPESVEAITKMAQQVDDIYKRIERIETFLGDMMPIGGKVSKEVGPEINELREKFERDETLELLKKVGDNIPTFVELLSTMEALKGMLDDMMPVVGKVTKEVGGGVNELREKFERDETLELLKKVGDNIPTFVELLSTMEALKGMLDDMMPASSKILKEVSPTINMIREALERDELLIIIQQIGENLKTFQKLLAFLSTFEKTGNLDITLEEAMTRETEYLMKGLLICARKTMMEIEEKPIEPSMTKLITKMWDHDVQRGLLLMTSLVKNMYSCMVSAMEEEKIEKQKQL